MPVAYNRFPARNHPIMCGGTMKPDIKKILPANLANSKRMLPAAILLTLVVIVGGFYLIKALVAGSAAITASGTVEATEIHLASETGGRVRKVLVEEGESVAAGQTLVEFHPASGSTSNTKVIEQIVRAAITAPIDGTVLERSVEPGEVASAGSTLITLANLEKLTLTVYVPEDQYGVIKLGAAYPVSVDSFPGVVFRGTVSHIADKAEFTPRNVQTTDSRKNTVFAIRLSLDPSGGKLKPGMPADVTFTALQ
jgi:HlyD family secretion protein